MNQQVLGYENYELKFIDNWDDLFKISAARFKPLNMWADARIRRTIADWKQAGLTYEDAEKIGIILPTEEAVAKVHDQKKLTVYSLSDYDVKSLYMNIIKVKNEQDLLSLTKNYGLLEGIAAFNPSNYVDNYNPGNMLFDFATTRLLIEKIEQIKGTYEIWRKIQTDRIYEIKDQLEFYGWEFEVLYGRKYHDLKELAVYVLNNQFHRSKGETLLGIVGNKIQRHVFYDNLIDLAYAQLFNAIFGDVEIKQCKHCELDFEVAHAKQQYCPPFRGKQNSTCQNTRNTRQKRKRKNQSKGE